MHMQFSEDSQHSYFFSQPHQPFFVLAFVNATISMLVFFLAYKGILRIDIDFIHFHAYSLIYLVFTPAFFAFLFTTFPRFTSTPSIDKIVYIRVFAFYYLGATLFIIGSMASIVFSAIGMVLTFIGNTWGIYILSKIYKGTTMEDKHDIFWILVALYSGLIAHILFIIGEVFYVPLIAPAIEIAVYLFLFMTTFSIAQRMVPFFSHCMIEKNTTFLKTVYILLVLHVLIEMFIVNGSYVIDFIIAVIIGKELYRWKLPFPNTNPLLWILHLSLFWIPIAFLLSSLSNILTLHNGNTFLALDIHAITLGFVFSILIGFGTRVTLGHSGNIMQADN